MLRSLRLGLCLAPLLLAACGGGEETTLAETCTADGGDKAYCECRAKSLAADMSDEDLALLVKMTRLQKDESISTEEAQERLFKDAGPARLMAFQFAVMAPLMKAEEKCL